VPQSSRLNNGHEVVCIHIDGMVLQVVMGRFLMCLDLISSISYGRVECGVTLKSPVAHSEILAGYNRATDLTCLKED
jgi:hypothetical protein